MTKDRVYLFDFGNVFINLDTQATTKELTKLGLKEFTSEMIAKNHLYEKGLISTQDFLTFYKKQFKEALNNELIDAWNSILLDFPLERLEFIEAFSKDHRCMLLSNINDMHLRWIQNRLGEVFYNRFIVCFEKVYYSHEIHMRKPDMEIYRHVLSDTNLKGEDIFFIDDLKENTEAAKKVGFSVWNLDPQTEDVRQLKDKI